jgi:SAM-dependent methyltransferase
MKSGQRRWNLNIHYRRIVLDSIPAGATTALDIGSGNGLLSFDLAAQGLQVVGIDPDEASIERARSDPDWYDRTTFLHGDVFTYPFEAGSFDLVTASAMLHHVDAVRPPTHGGTCSTWRRRRNRRLRESIRTRRLGPRRRRLLRHEGASDHGSLLGGSRTRWPPPLTIEMRTLAELEMPGATFKRRMAHRYSIVWSRQITSTSP